MNFCVKVFFSLFFYKFCIICCCLLVICFNSTFGSRKIFAVIALPSYSLFASLFQYNLVAVVVVFVEILSRSEKSFVGFLC